nr:hypothetical protein GCM10020063_025170 [Dactylosporangium thailandense]
METGPPEQHIDRLRFWAAPLHTPHDLLLRQPKSPLRRNVRSAARCKTKMEVELSVDRFLRRNRSTERAPARRRPAPRGTSCLRNASENPGFGASRATAYR